MNIIKLIRNNIMIIRATGLEKKEFEFLFDMKSDIIADINSSIEERHPKNEILDPSDLQKKTIRIVGG